MEKDDKLNIKIEKIKSVTPLPIVNNKKIKTEGKIDFVLVPLATLETQVSTNRYTNEKMSTHFETIESNRDDAMPFEVMDEIKLKDKKRSKGSADSLDECELDLVKNSQSESEDEEEKKDLAYKLVDIDEVDDPMLGRKSV